MSNVATKEETNTGTVTFRRGRREEKMEISGAILKQLAATSTLAAPGHQLYGDDRPVTAEQLREPPPQGVVFEWVEMPNNG